MGAAISIRKLRWFYYLSGSDWPLWKQSACIDDQGTIFVPVALAGEESAVLLGVSQDGLILVKEANHNYVPADWLVRVYPKFGELRDKITCALISHPPYLIF